MDNTSAPAPTHADQIRFAVIDDIKRDGGMIRYNSDGDVRVSFPRQMGEIRARRILHELYG